MEKNKLTIQRERYRMKFSKLVVVLILMLSGQIFAQNQTEDPFQASVEQVQDRLADGLFLDNIDAVVRVRNRSGTGTGSIFFENEDHYYMISNWHVMGTKGKANTIDVWNNGVLQQSIPVKVQEHFHEDQRSVDIAYSIIPKADFGGEMPVIPLAPESYELNVEDKLWQIGCDAGNWPNAERGQVIRRQNGLIYYLPNSIPGNSGGPIYSADGRYMIGLTAWVLNMNYKGKNVRVGLAMDYKLVRGILSGRVSSYPDLPDGAEEIGLCTFALLPENANEVPLAPIKEDFVHMPSAGVCDDCTEFLGQQTEWRKPGGKLDGRFRKGTQPKRSQPKRSQPDLLPVPPKQEKPDFGQKPDTRPDTRRDVEIDGRLLEVVAQALVDSSEAHRQTSESLNRLVTGVQDCEETGIIDWFKNRRERREGDADRPPRVDPPENNHEFYEMAADTYAQTLLTNQKLEYHGKKLGEIKKGQLKKGNGGLLGFGLFRISPFWKFAFWTAAIVAGGSFLFGNGWIVGLVGFLFSGLRNGLSGVSNLRSKIQATEQEVTKQEVVVGEPEDIIKVSGKEISMTQLTKLFKEEIKKQIDS